MRFILLMLFIILPYFSFAQGKGQEKKFKIKIETKEYLTDELPDELDLPQRLNRVWIKEEKDKDNKDKKDKDKVKNAPDNVTNTYTMMVGEEERSFLADGEYYEC